MESALADRAHTRPVDREDPAEQEKPVVRMRLWIEADGGILFGSGRALLLERIERYGSLKKAAESLGMSYRAAWGKIKQTEEVLGRKLIEKRSSNREGYALTPLGRDLTRIFMAWVRSVETEAVQKAVEMFSFDCVSYTDWAARAEKEAGPGFMARLKGFPKGS